jgi:AcrR family transcriptional regulator
MATMETQILRAANNIFQTKGLSGARMQEIANEAKINKSMLHYYFKNKKTLFEASFIDSLSTLVSQLNIILNDEITIVDKIEKFTNNYALFISKHPHITTYIIQELNMNPKFTEPLITSQNFPSMEKFNKQVEQEVKQGILIPTSGEQLFVHIISLTIFPFMASFLLDSIIGRDQNIFPDLLEKRKTEISDFIINSIKHK